MKKYSSVGVIFFAITVCCPPAWAMTRSDVDAEKQVDTEIESDARKSRVWIKHEGIATPFCDYEQDNPSFLDNILGTVFKYDFVRDIKGPVRRVAVEKTYPDSNTKTRLNFNFDKNEKLISQQEFEGKSRSFYAVYEYNDKGDLIKVTNDNGMKKSYFLFTYYPKRNMTIVREYVQPDNKWFASYAVVQETLEDGQNICYTMEAALYGNESSKHTLSSDKHQYKTQIHQIPENSPAGKSDNEKTADEAMLVMLNEMKSSSYTCSQFITCWTKNMTIDNGLIKYEDAHSVNWYNKNYTINETVDVNKHKLLDGTPAHVIYKYIDDAHGNWIKRQEFVQESPTLTDDHTRWKLLAIEDRNIDYFK